MEPILPASHEMDLLSHEERIEEKSLPDELTEPEQQIPPSRYTNKKNYDDRGQSVNAKIEEIDRHINNQPVSNAVAKSVVKWNETLNNGKPIDWDFWLELDNIKPEQAAKLAHNIDSRLWPGNSYAAGKPYDLYPDGDKIDKELSIEIQSLKLRLDNHSKEWSLANLVSFLGEENAPFAMLEAIKELTRAESANLKNDIAPDVPEQDLKAIETEPARAMTGRGTNQNITDELTSGEDSEVSQVKAAENCNTVIQNQQAVLSIPGSSEIAIASEGKPRRKLKPFERDCNQGLLLIQEMVKKYQVEYLDDLPTSKAWGLIVSGEFVSEYIKIRPEHKNGHIVLQDGEKLTKSDFIDKYRRRFESIPKSQ